MKTSEFLSHARSLIEDPEHWASEPLERNFEGPAGKMCALDALGHVEYVTAEDYTEAYHALQDALPVGNFGMVALFNDSMETQHDDVLALYDRAIVACQEEGR